MTFSRKSKAIKLSEISVEEKMKVLERIGNELVQAFNYIINEKTWCKRAMCRDVEGEQLFYPGDERAVQWCIYGAMHKAECSETALTFIKNYAKLNEIEDLMKFNDASEHYDVSMFMVGALKMLGVKLIFYDAEGNVQKELG
jgi:hypothetical protein